MKKIWSLILSLSLLLSLAAPAFAEETENEPSGPEDAAAPSAQQTLSCRTMDAPVSLAGNQNLLKTCDAAFLYELNSDTLLYAYNPDMQMFPGSLTKIMTCLILAEKGNMDDQITVTQAALDAVPWNAYGMDLVVGEIVTMEQLMYAIMVESANDAVTVAALHVTSTVDAFVEEMNRRAEELGCTGTHFDNPYGLHSEGNYTTARDMAKITREAVKIPVFWDCYSTSYYEMPATNLSEPRYFRTSNYMIYSTVMFNYYDPSIQGGKVGATYMDTWNAVISAEKRNTKYIVVTLGGDITINEETGATLVFGNLEDARGLLDFAYEDYKNAETVCAGQAVAQYPVVNGANDVALGAKEGVLSLLPANMTSAEIRREVHVDESLLKAPLEEGVTVGTLECWYRNFCVGTTELVTLAPVAVSTASVPLDGVQEQAPEAAEDKGSGSKTVLEVFGAVFLVLLFVFLAFTVRTFVIRSRRQRRRDRRRAEERRRRR